jgi:hypothetical protein
MVIPDTYLMCGQAARTTNPRCERSEDITTFLIDIRCLLSSLELIRSNVRLLDEVGRAREKYFAAKDRTYFVTVRKSGQVMGCSLPLYCYRLHQLKLWFLSRITIPHSGRVLQGSCLASLGPTIVTESI